MKKINRERFYKFMIILMLTAWMIMPAVSTSAEKPEHSTGKEEKVELILYMPVQPKYGKELRVMTTYYNPTRSQCDGDPYITADGSKIDKEKLENGELKWVAISQDLLAEYPFKTKIKIESEKYPELNGIYIVHDVMNRRVEYSIDLIAPEGKRLFGMPHLSSIKKILD